LVPAVKLAREYALLVLVTVVHVEVPATLYSTLYLIASHTAPQFKLAELEVIDEAVSETGVAQVGVPMVANVSTDEVADSVPEHKAYALHSQVVPDAKPVRL
jgi:hypothetical protein